MDSDLAPIALFVYNRPDHTLRTLEALSNNKLSDRSHLIIYCDGPKNSAGQDEANSVNAVRKLVSKFHWPGTKEIYEEPFNKGLSNSVIDGITATVTKYGKVIVIEDDIVTSPGFITYMNDALKLYEQDKQVMSVTGYCFPCGHKKDTFLIKAGTSTWAWGTWYDSWKLFNSNAQELLDNINSKSLSYQFNFKNSYDYHGMLQKQVNGHIDSWGIRWYASVLLNEGYGLWPGQSLANNIGHDNSGSHCTTENRYWHDKLSEGLKVEPISNINNDKSEYLRIVKFYRRFHQRNWKSKLKSSIFNLLQINK